jgi:hypothetical protein
MTEGVATKTRKQEKDEVLLSALRELRARSASGA